MSKDRIWFIKCEYERKHFLTLFEDGYVMNEKGKKMFVLQKAAMQQVKNLVQEYSSTDDGSNDNPKITIKCNLNSIYVSHNRDFAIQLAHLLFNNDNIKHPNDDLATVIDILNELEANGDLHLLYEDEELMQLLKK